MENTKITGDLLVEWGFPHSPEFGEALRTAKMLAECGTPLDGIKQTVMGMLPPEKIEMREDSVPFSEAIKVETEEEVENRRGVRRQMHQLMRCPVVKRGAIMPDSCPAGMQVGMIPVGGAIEVDNAIIPAAHSADICCSMFATFFDSDTPSEEILDRVMERSHFGYGGRDEPLLDYDDLPAYFETNPFLNGLEKVAMHHMGTQGDGNHFTYLGEVLVDDRLLDGLAASGVFVDHLRERYVGKTLRVLVTHHGSRGFGAQVYKRGAKAADKHTNKIAKGVPKACHWIPFDTPDGKDYWDALCYVAQWTKENHLKIHALCLPTSTHVASFGNEHNFVWKRGDSFYHGKGATPSWSSGREKNIGIIPLNMSQPILLTTSADNEEFLSFAPHGAGRNRSRTATLAPFRNEDGSYDNEKLAAAIAEDTEGIDARWFSGKADLSECPRGYKDAEAVKSQIEEFGLANLIGEIQPIGCVMAGEQPPAPWQLKKKKSD